jgi:hypothetical protein
MIVTPYYIEKFGLNLEAAVIEIKELTTRNDLNFEDKEDMEIPFKDAFVNIVIWVNEESYKAGKQPLHIEKRPILVDYLKKTEFHQAVLIKILEDQI